LHTGVRAITDDVLETALFHNLLMQTKPEDGGLQYRAVFDADVTFSNGGGLQAQRFRVDSPSRFATAEEIGELFVRSLDLLMTQTLTVRDVDIIEEAHKGTRGGPSDPREG
jgi:hypothetical protein